ncbi:MAG: hypothetical protein KIS91_09000, partial [Anaerolineae bacterium]|nr:hypothetical protein [Anaerolineae bacterium]
PVRVVGAVASADDARVATGLAGSGAERLAGRGDFLVVAHGVPHRLQAAYIAPADIEQLVRRLNEGTGVASASPPRPVGAVWATGWRSVAERVRRVVNG